MMRKKVLNKKMIAMVLLLGVLILNGCSDKEKINKSSDGMVTTGKTESTDISTSQPASVSRKENTMGEETKSGTEQGTENKEETLEANLAKYREARASTIEEKDGLVSMGAPNEAEYGLDLSGLQNMADLDSRELTEAYAAAGIYKTDTLGLKGGMYMCSDPRILEIYEDDDKGVAAGYDNSNIFVCEYLDESNIWQYMILVREGEGKPWQVIHHGSSYKE